jgi:hypothetical protein
VKNLVSIFGLVVLLHSAHGQHTHIGAGAATQTPGTPLQFSSGYTAGATYHLLAKPVGQRYGGFYSLDEQPRPVNSLGWSDYFTFIALSDGQSEEDGPFHAATGSELHMEIVSVTGPAGAHFGFWDENWSHGNFTPTKSFATGQPTGSNNTFILSDPIGDGDPYGHIHNRGWTADVPGAYVVGFRIFDANAIHTPSPIYSFNFQAVAVVSTWTLNGSGSWSTSLAGNWSAGVPFGNGSRATFGPAATAPATVSVNGSALTVGSITFNNTNSYTVSGPNTITLADGTATPTLGVTLGSHTISAPLVLSQNATVSTAPGTGLTLTGVTGGASSLSKTGDGILNLDGTQNYAALQASAGTTNVDGALGTGTSSVSVTGAGTALKFGTVSQTLSSLTIGAGATVTFTSGAASFAGGGKTQGFGGSAVVPEPGSLALLLAGSLGLLRRARR